MKEDITAFLDEEGKVKNMAVQDEKETGRIRIYSR